MAHQQDNLLALTDLIDTDHLQSLQDSFAAMTHLSMYILDGQGRPLTQPTGKPAFCTTMQESESGDEACQASHHEATQLSRTTTTCQEHTCHAGLLRFVAPILVNGTHLGAIIVGDRPVRRLEYTSLDQLSQTHGLPLPVLTQTADELGSWTDADRTVTETFVRHFADSISRFCQQASNLKQRADELAALNQLSALLAGRASLQEILDTATEQLTHHMDLRASGLRLLDEDTGVLRIASVANLSRDYLDKEAIPAAESEVDSEAMEGKTVYIADMRCDPRVQYQDKAREEGLVSVLVVPLIYAGKTLGVLRAYTRLRREFSEFEQALLAGTASLVASAIVHVRLHRDAEERMHLERQVKMAAEVQRRMIPENPPEHVRYNFGCVYEPSTDLGGDFYDFSKLPDGSIGMIIADVVGKGFPASLLMSCARSSLRSHAESISDVGSLMTALNRRLCRDTLPAEFVTACLCIFENNGKKLTWCNAGHEPPILWRRGRITELEGGSIALGILTDAEYDKKSIELLPDDLIVMITDGVTDAMDYDGRPFGRQRLHNSIKLYGSMAADMPAGFIAKQLLWDVRRYAGLATQHDDITCVVARVSDQTKTSTKPG